MALSLLAKLVEDLRSSNDDDIGSTTILLLLSPHRKVVYGGYCPCIYEPMNTMSMITWRKQALSIAYKIFSCI